MNSYFKTVLSIVLGRAPKQFELGEGWSARWVYRDNFILSREGYSYEIYAEPALEKNVRILRLAEMPRVWLPPHEQDAITDSELEVLVALAQRVVVLNRETLRIER